MPSFSSHLAHHRSPRRDQPASPACLTCPTSSPYFTWVAHLQWSFTCSPSLAHLFWPYGLCFICPPSLPRLGWSFFSVYFPLLYRLNQHACSLLLWIFCLLCWLWHTQAFTQLLLVSLLFLTCVSFKKYEDAIFCEIVLSFLPWLVYLLVCPVSPYDTAIFLSCRLLSFLLCMDSYW